MIIIIIIKIKTIDNHALFPLGMWDLRNSVQKLQNSCLLSITAEVHLELRSISGGGNSEVETEGWEWRLGYLVKKFSLRLQVQVDILHNRDKILKVKVIGR